MTVWDLCTRGEPGIDWNIDSPTQSDITKVFYNALDTNTTGRVIILHACICYQWIFNSFRILVFRYVKLTKCV